MVKPPSTAKPTYIGAQVIALVWGFAEATLFFVVPDVWISLVALRSMRQGLLASGLSVIGALCGGAIIYWLGVWNQAATLAVFDYLPSIGLEMIAQVQRELNTLGHWAQFEGPRTGTPYKLYAAQSAAAGVGFFEFLLISIPARGIRFVFVTLLVAVAALWAIPRFGIRRVRLFLLMQWALIYGVYWSVVPN